MKIIAESASNHNGELKDLKALALAAKNAGADYFTFQILNPEFFCAAEYERYDLVSEIALDNKEWASFIEYCRGIKMDMIPCPLDLDSFEFCRKNGFELIKIHATDIVNLPFLKAVRQAGVQVILETQCATYQDIQFALGVIGEQVDAIIHGYSNYPTEIEDQRLNSLDAIQQEFNCETGFADHSLDLREIPLMVLAKGAKYLEKHITLSRNDRKYDWQVSLYPEEFSIMVQTIRHYKKALGLKLKHPDKTESAFRGVLYKKVLNGDLEGELKRADNGQDYLTSLFDSFDKKKIGVGIIARLKSKRLKEKVLKPFHNSTIIEDLYHRIGTTPGLESVSVITSFLPEDGPLVSYCESNGLNVFKGHPESVIDRMLSFILQNKLGIICRVTGDNPFSDPSVLQAMIGLMQNNELDYVKVNNLPIGMGVELYATSYLWRMYLQMENPLTSEYLAWYALNDQTSRKGCVDIKYSDPDLSFYNLSVDYQEDYDRCQMILSAIGKEEFKEIRLQDVLPALSNIEPSDRKMNIKLPGGESCTFEEFNALIDSSNYETRLSLSV
ncbi:N-acetylneuraminate synthase family protein [Robiginitalea sp. IMCC43444]|uniref:N-acetylneuraminate synthase family protein n=1 Tax=Robiginitalea sp. IMCC43444 TaxID=3459121 RepID=UPI0040410603